MTPAQKKMLKRLAAQAAPYTPIEHNFKSKTHMLNRLVEAGLAAHYVHGGYTITEAGRKAIAGEV